MEADFAEIGRDCSPNHSPFPPRHTARLHIPVSLVVRGSPGTEFWTLECGSEWYTPPSSLGYRSFHTIFPVLSLLSSASQTQRIQGNLQGPRVEASKLFPLKGQRVNIVGFGGYTVSPVITQLCSCVRKATVNNM